MKRVAVLIMFKFLTLFQQSNEVGGSGRMEKEGLVRSLSFLEASGVTVKDLVTDRHPQIQKYMRENKPGVNHFYDVWHIAKGIFLIGNLSGFTLLHATTSL